MAVAGRLLLVEADETWYLQNIRCQGACPVRTEAYRYIRAIRDGRFQEAFEIARRPNPFPAVCGRICAHPCEAACRRGIIDKPISIRALKRTAVEMRDRGLGAERVENAPRPEGAGPGFGARPRREERVAVVGAGPAGLACAHDLARLGYRVTIFDPSRALGGMLSLGVPEYRLPRDVVREEVEAILALGVEVEPRALGPDFGLAGIRARGFAATFIAVGAHKSRDLRIPGVDLDGVVRGVEFLLNVNLGYRVWLGHKVAVVGGGNVALDIARVALREGTQRSAAAEAALAAAEAVPPYGRPYEDGSVAVDAARAALRMGAREVHIVALESRVEMPAHHYEVEQAEGEGIRVHPSRGPKRIVGLHGRVEGLETLRCTRVFDERGRFAPEFAEGSEETIDCDSVILAIGQSSDLSFLKPEDGVAVTRRGTIEVDPETLATTAPGVYAGGDVAFGPRIAIDAIADGGRAARAIHARLTGGRARRVRRSAFVPADPRDLLDPYDGTPRIEPPEVPVDRRVGFAAVEEPYAIEAALAEANRCLRCDIDVLVDGAACVLCGGCVDVCPTDCIEMVSLERIERTEGAPALPELDGARAAAEGGAALVIDERACIRCGLCAIRCPTDAIALGRFECSEEWREEEGGHGG